jgi:hypothetical protein
MKRINLNSNLILNELDTLIKKLFTLGSSRINTKRAHVPTDASATILFWTLQNFPCTEIMPRHYKIAFLRKDSIVTKKEYVEYLFG